MAGGLHDAERAVPEPEHRHGRVPVVGLREALVEQDDGPGVDLLDLADEEAGEVEVVDGHVEERAAGGQQELERRRVGVAGVGAELLDPAELAGVDQLPSPARSPGRSGA